MIILDSISMYIQFKIRDYTKWIASKMCIQFDKYNFNNFWVYLEFECRTMKEWKYLITAENEFRSTKNMFEKEKKAILGSSYISGIHNNGIAINFRRFIKNLKKYQLRCFWTFGS